MNSFNPHSLFFILLWICQAVTSLNNNPLLLIVSLDGFRYDLLNSSLAPNLWAFAEKGVNFVNGLRSQFPTFTLPNHITMVTGLAVENHEIVDNRFYDPDRRIMYDLLNISGKAGVVEPSMDPKYYTKAEPIWLTNERGENDRRSASIGWPAGDVSWATPPHRPKIFKPWIDDETRARWMAEFDYILSIFLDDSEPVNFAAWYIGEPDETLHENGFFNGQIQKTVQELDLLFEYVFSRIENEPELAQRLNIIITADHGHAEINGPQSVLCLPDHVDMADMPYGDLMLYVQDRTRRDEIFQILKNAIASRGYEIDIYKKEEFPNPRYGNNLYVGDIIFVPHVGFAVHEECTKEMFDLYFETLGLPFHKATHGMDPNHWMMRSLLLLKGPAFKENFKIEEIADNIDLYSLMCHVLGVTEAPNNGSLNRIAGVLRPPRHSASAVVSGLRREDEFATTFLTVLIPSAALVFFLAVSLYWKQRGTATVRGVAHFQEHLIGRGDEGSQRKRMSTEMMFVILIFFSLLYAI